LVREEKGDEPPALIAEPTEPPTAPPAPEPPPPAPAPVAAPAPAPVAPPVEWPATIATGRVAGLRAGRITIREPDTAGGFTNRDYAIARRVALRGIESLSALQLDHRITFRIIEPDGKPTIIEIATPGFQLIDPHNKDTASPP
jgi:hypothetical protein